MAILDQSGFLPYRNLSDQGGGTSLERACQLYRMTCKSEDSELSTSTTDALGPDLALLINGQTNECRLDDWRRNSVLPTAFYKQFSVSSHHYDFLRVKA